MNFISNKTRLVLALLPIMAGSLTGCASSNPGMLLALPNATNAGNTSTAVRTLTASMPVAAIARLDIPEYLSSRRVRYKVDASTVAEWPSTYWAERIEISASREFTRALQAQLPAWRLCEGSCAEQSPATMLQVAITQMDYVRTDRKLYGAAKLTINGQERAGNTLLGEERRYEVSASGDSAQAQAEAIAELLRRVAVDAATLIAPAA